MYKVEIAQNESEADEAYELVSKSFGPNYFDAKRNWDIRRKFDPTARLENLFIIKDDNNSVIATTITLTRNVRLFGRDFTVGAPTANAVHPKFRGKALFIKLNRFMLNEMSNRNLSLCFTYARRLADYSMVKFGFWGAPVERKYIVLDPPKIKENRVTYRKLQIEDIPVLEKLYRDVYGCLSFFVDRPKELWLTKMKSPSFNTQYASFGCLDKETKSIIGYVIAEQGKGIIELCVDPDNLHDYDEILFSPESPVRKYTDAGLALSTEHPALLRLRGYSYSVYTRHPNYGGHIIRILDPYDSDSDIMQLVKYQLSRRGAIISKNYEKYPEYVCSRVVTAALFGYEIPETGKILEITDQDKWDMVKPTDLLFSQVDEF